MNVVTSDNFLIKSKEDIGTLKNFIFEIKKIFVDSVKTNSLYTFSDEFTKILDGYEEIYNTKIYKNEDNELIYYYGFLMAIATVGKELSKNEFTKESLKDINNYPLLIKVMAVISDKGSMSATNLKKEINIKNISTLNNLLARVERFKIIETKKVGRSRYYFLTLKGRELSKYVNKNDLSSITANDFIYFLNKLAQYLDNNDQNVLNLINDSFIKYLPMEYINISKVKLLKLSNIRNNKYLRNNINKNNKFSYDNEMLRQTIDYKESVMLDEIY